MLFKRTVFLVNALCQAKATTFKGTLTIDGLMLFTALTGLSHTVAITYLKLRNFIGIDNNN